MCPAGIQVVDRRRAIGFEPEPVAVEAQRLQRLSQHIERPGIGRRDARAADQGLGQCDGIGNRRAGHHARSSSLIEVLERVLSSTCFTITAQ